jgi:hypothetical protein
MEIQKNSPELIKKIRSLNPNIKILAYITSQEMTNNPGSYQNLRLRQALNSRLEPEWFLKDQYGRQVVHWPFTSMLNVSNEAKLNANNLRFNDILPQFVCSDIKGSDLWDGVFYDNLWGDIAWMNNGNLDFENNGEKTEATKADILWREGMAKILSQTKLLCGDDFIVVGNGRIHWPYQSLLNGMMLEGFPPPWEGDGTWLSSMKSYNLLHNVNQQPLTSLINVFNKNQTDYRLFRFGLTSTLLGDAYYSFDYDVTNHGQLWWYDEYNVLLGQPQSSAYNILNNGSTKLEPGLWRRDFENGVAIVNSTDTQQNFFFSKEEFEKIKGIQDPQTNDGLKINYLRIPAKDGIILLKKLTAWQGSSFTNGAFLRIFSPQGEQSRNGFFSYITSLPAGSEVLVDQFDKHNKTDYIYIHEGRLSRQRDGKTIWSTQVFSPGFKGPASLAVADTNGNGHLEIIVGAGAGGGPQVLIVSLEGKLLSNFFAYDKNFRGGVNVAAGDINGDGKAEIVTGAGEGGGPHVRYFNDRGEFRGHFFAYDENFRGGVNVAAGDINGDGKAEIVTGAGPGGGPQVKIFNAYGSLQSSFFAFDQDFKEGIEVGYSQKGFKPEISVGIKGF